MAWRLQPRAAASYDHDTLQPAVRTSICTGEKTAARAGIGPDRCYGQLTFAAQNGFGQIIDGVDIGPGSFCCRAAIFIGGFNQIEVNAIRPEICAAQQHDDLHGAGGRPAEGSVQAFALPRTHRAVIKIERQKSNAVRLFPGNVLPCCVVDLVPVVECVFGEGAGFRKSDAAG